MESGKGKLNKQYCREEYAFNKIAMSDQIQAHCNSN